MYTLLQTWVMDLAKEPVPEGTLLQSAEFMSAAHHLRAI
jgi:hypothetical protein